MIIINFFPGSMGFLILKTIHAHWPNKFFYKESSVGSKYDNHDVCPDVFLSNHSEISQTDYKKMFKSSTHPSLILSHNVGLLPTDLLNNSWICDIFCNLQSQSTATFLFYIKSGNFIFNYINNSQQDFYQEAFVQLSRFLKMENKYPSQLAIDFKNLNKLDTLFPLLDQVRKEYQLPIYCPMHNWYKTEYQRSMRPLTIYAEIYEKFNPLFTLMQEMLPPPNTHYTSFFNLSQQLSFRKTMDLLSDIARYNEYHK
jgi:hypothetical protein